MKHDRILSDNYPTPEGLARWCVRHALDEYQRLNDAEPDLVFEPGCGDAAPFARAAREFVDGVRAVGFELRKGNAEIAEMPHGSGVEVVAGMDYLDPPSEVVEAFSGRVDVIATNPPFNYAEPFVRRSIEMLSDRGVLTMLLRVGFLSSLKRRSLFEELPPAIVTILQKRPSFAFGATDSQEYAVMTWFGRRVEFGETVLRWLDNSKIPGGASHPKKS